MRPEFWTDDPRILVAGGRITEIIPNASMTQAQRFNALTRLSILVAVLGGIVGGMSVVIAGLVAVAILAAVYTAEEGARVREGYGQTPQTPADVEDGADAPGVAEMTAQNPTGARLLGVPLSTQDPGGSARLTPATLNEKALDAIASVNADDGDESDMTMRERLFADLGDKDIFDHSMRQFYTPPAHTHGGGYKRYLDYLYGNMTSCKEGDAAACVRGSMSNWAMLHG